MCSFNCRWEAGLVCHMAESYNKNLWCRHCVLWHVSTYGGTKSSERERLNNMFVRQGANCSLLVLDQVPVGLKEIFTQHSTWTTGHGATTNRCCCRRNPNQAFKLFTAPKMPIPLQKKPSHGFLFFFSRYWLFIQKASTPALSSALSILQLSFYNLAHLKRCWRKASPQKSLLLLLKQKRFNSNIQQCCRQILSSTSSNDLQLWEARKNTFSGKTLTLGLWLSITLQQLATSIHWTAA